jgi:hypothetical protein
MLGNRRLSQRHFVNNLTADAGVTADQQSHNPHPCWMRNCPCQCCDLFGGLISRQTAGTGVVTAWHLFDSLFWHRSNSVKLIIVDMR